jgi:elongator complex protein 1
MRNLQLLEHFKCSLAHENALESRAFTAVDPDSGDVYAALATENEVKVLIQALDEVKPGTFTEMCNFPAMERGDGGNVIIDFVYLPDTQSVCLCLNTGDIALINKERFEAGVEALEIVGTVDSGIQAMSWSPDQEVVVVITGKNICNMLLHFNELSLTLNRQGARTALEMTRDFDTITEFPLDTDEEGEGTFLSMLITILIA